MDKNTIDALTFTAGMLLIVFIAAVAFSVVIGIGMYCQNMGNRAILGHRAMSSRNLFRRTPFGLIGDF